MEKYKYLIEKIKDELKILGFTKKGSTYYTRESNNWGLINFQKSRHSSNDQILFTIDLGVCSEKIANFLSHLSVGKPGIESCHWKERIGFLMDQRKDYWWEINSDTDIEPVSNEILSV